MDVILLKDVEKLGDKNEVVSVKPGYARNYLFPNGLAITANKSNLKTLHHILRREEEKELEKLSDYQEMAASFEGKVLRIGAKAGSEGKIFGSVTTVQDRKSTRLNSSHVAISYAVFCLKKKNTDND